MAKIQWSKYNGQNTMVKIQWSKEWTNNDLQIH